MNAIKFNFLIVLWISSFQLQASNFPTEKTINAAKAKACQENKIVIMEFTAKWCIPAKDMEKAVFENVKVQQFIAEHAIFFQVDIDEQKNLKAEYKIQALPTIILMKASGKILSRKEESFNAESFIAWVEENLESMPKPESVKNQSQESAVDENVSIELPLIELDEFDSEKISRESNLIEISASTNNESSFQNNTNFKQNLDGATKSYHIQAGVFSSRDNADNLSIQLAASFNQQILIATETGKTKTAFKVRIGEFESEEEALMFLAYMQKNHFTGVVKAN